MSLDPTAEQLAERSRLRRRNSVIALVFALALCLAAVVLAVNSLGSVGDATAEPDQTVDTAAPGLPSATPPPAEGAAPADPAAPPAAAAATTFSSPSGNIGCSMTTEGARCDIVDRTWDPGAPPADCTGTWGAGMQVGAGGAAVVCAADSVLGGETQLAYGASSEVGTFRCTSTEAGMRCEDVGTGRGFALARSDYTLF